MRAKYIITHPSSYFVASWIFAVSLSCLNLVPRITGDYKRSLVIVVGILLFHSVGLTLGWLAVQKRSVWPFERPTYHFGGRHRWLGVWAGITLIEVVFSHGLPVLWVLNGDSRTYEDFGIPSIHGVMNAIYLYLAISSFINLLQSKRLSSALEFILLLSWSFIVISRALITVIALVVTVFYAINTKMRVWALLTIIALVSFAFILVFGYLGDSRAEQFSITAATGIDLDNRLSGLVWVYAYVTSPLANLTLNVATHSEQLKIVPQTFLSPLVPSFVQHMLGFETGFFSFSGYLAHEAFNVGTAFMQIYIDWGLTGVFFYDVVIAFFGHVIWRKFIDTGRSDILALYIACALLTIFSSQFNQLPIMLLVALLWAGVNVRYVSTGRGFSARGC